MKRVAVGSCIVITLLAESAAADAAPVVRWQAPSECPAEGYVAREATDLALGAAEAPVEQVEADIAIERTADGRYRAAIRTRRGGDVGERTIDADTCKQAADTAALIVAMLVAPLGSVPAEPELIDFTELTGPAMAGPLPPPSPSVAAPMNPSKEAPQPGAVGPEPGRFQVAVSALADAGSLPRAGFGGTVTAGMRIASLRLEASASHLPTQTVASAEEGKGGRVSLTTGSVRAALPFGTTTIEIAPAAGLEVGWMAGEGYGVRHPISDGALWLGLVGGVAARWPARSVVAMRGQLDAVVPLDRKEFQLSGDTVHLPGAVVARASLGVAVEF